MTDELDERAAETLEGDKFVSVEEHEKRREKTDTHTACANKKPNDLFHCERPNGHDGPHHALDGDIEWENQ